MCIRDRDFKEKVNIRKVENVPVLFPHEKQVKKYDSEYLGDEPGLYPDIDVYKRQIPDIVIAPLLDLDQLRQFLSSLIIAAYHEINCHIGCRKLVFQHDDAAAGQVPKPCLLYTSYQFVIF